MTTGFSRSRGSGLLLIALLCFFLSGAAGLIYEVVWTRMLTQIFGNTTYAIATVLAAFMAGLAIGSYSFGRIADRGHNDFLLYGILEAGVGIYGLVVPWLFDAGRRIYIPLFHINDAYPYVFNLLLFFLSFLLLVIPTLLMGATLPLLSRFFVKSFTDLGRRVGDLYATNTLGAVLGCALSGYYLIPAYGMRTTVYIAAALNLAIAVVIIIVDRLRDKEVIEPAPAEEPAGADAAPGAAPSNLGWVLLFSMCLSGMAALVYENAWTRVLTLVIGSSIYSFTTMLVTFLVGLALGGFLYARAMGEREVRMATFGVIELLVGLTALATIPLFEKLPLIFLRLLHGFGDSFHLFLSIQVAISAMVMVLPTLLLGMTFPLVARLFTQSLYRVGSSVGTSYAANTLGAILGAFAGGFILIPTIGVQNSILFAVILNLLIGWFLIVADPRMSLAPRLVLGLAVLAAIVVIPLKTPSWDQHVMTSGVTVYSDRYTNLHRDSLRVEEMHRDKILYYKEGLTATVSVHQSTGSEYKYFRTNGKIDGSHGDALSQLMTGYIPMLFHPTGERAAVIGLGTGMTSKAVAAFPVREVEVLEIEPAMREATKFFNDKNGKILENPKVRVIPTDGRNYILATPKVYDVIAAEPSNPWIAGIANLYTREFYSVVKSKLKPDGIFAQWFHNYSMSPDDFRMVFRTFAEAFPYMTVWGMKESDFLMVGSMQEQVFRHTELKAIFAKNKILRADFEELGLSDPYATLGFYRMGREGALAFSEGAPLNTDDGAELEFSAPKNLGRATSELNRKLMQPHLSEAPWLKTSGAAPEAFGRYYLAQAHEANGWHSRALEEVERAIAADPKNADFYVLKARILLEAEKSSEAVKAAAMALERSPQALRAVLALHEEFYLPEAKVIYSKAIEMKSRDVQPYVGLGKIALYYRQLPEAEKWLEQAKQIQPDHKEVLLQWGRLLLTKGETEKAKDLLEQSKEKGEDTAALYSSLGEAYSKLELWQEAADAYRRALRFRRSNVEWRRNLGIALAKLGRVGEAEQKFREILAISSEDAEAWQELKKIGKRY
jgi:spermidine synthase